MVNRCRTQAVQVARIGPGRPPAASRPVAVDTTIEPGSVRCFIPDLKTRCWVHAQSLCYFSAVQFIDFIAGISAGYRVEEWEITDAEGQVVEPDSMRWDDDLTFTATRWELLETSLVTVPADAGAGIRAYPGGFDRALVIADLSERVQVVMLARMRIATRQRMYERQEALFA